MVTEYYAGESARNSICVLVSSLSQSINFEIFTFVESASTRHSTAYYLYIRQYSQYSYEAKKEKKFSRYTENSPMNTHCTCIFSRPRWLRCCYGRCCFIFVVGISTQMTELQIISSTLCVCIIKHKIIIIFSRSCDCRVEAILPYHSHMFSLWIHMHSIFSGAHTFTVLCGRGYRLQSLWIHTTDEGEYKMVISRALSKMMKKGKKTPKQNHY